MITSATKICFSKSIGAFCKNLFKLKGSHPSMISLFAVAPVVNGVFSFGWMFKQEFWGGRE